MLLAWRYLEVEMEEGLKKIAEVVGMSARYLRACDTYI